jgi:hypothetical protein
LAPSITALTGSSCILRPQTSHLKKHSPFNCLYNLVMFILVETRQLQCDHPWIIWQKLEVLQTTNLEKA